MGSVRFVGNISHRKHGIRNSQREAYFNKKDINTGDPHKRKFNGDIQVLRLKTMSNPGAGDT